MKKEYSKSELETLAKATVFKNFPNAKVAFATIDGQFFLEENRANLHAKAKGKVFTIENENENPIQLDKKKKLTADELIAEAKSFQSINEVETAQAIELDGKKRKTVLEAYSNRINELKNKA